MSDQAKSTNKRQRGLSRLAFWTARSQNSPQFPPALGPLLQALEKNHPKADPDIVLRAYRVAEKWHRGQTRKSGDPYITHPVAVATILAEIGMTPVTLAAALLHDTVEDTGYSLEDLRTDFGDEIALMVDGVTKLDKIQYGAAAQSETVRKMIVAMSQDIRVLVIKLADRLHNARTWKYVPASSSERKARETLEIFAPLAHRLGMNTIKWELEDLSFQVLYPKVYDEIVRLVAERTPEREKYLGIVSKDLGDVLHGAQIDATITGRPKHYYSIYQKMVVRGHEFGDIYDLVGVRVLVSTVNECYGVLGLVHAKWTPVPGRFKDYIAVPKFNMYQSLHTTVIGPYGKPVEIQIRTYEMDTRAEYGVAAHWRYKDRAKATAAGSGTGGRTVKVADSGELDQVNWLRQIMDWQQETEDPDEFLDNLRYQVRSQEVYAFTPQGDIITLPQHSTPVDFAYSVHTEVGHKTMGARVNGRLVPLDTELNNGDVVEVFTSKDEHAGPSRDWLTFVASPRARNKIRQWFSKERREEAIDNGRDQLARAMRRHHISAEKLMKNETLELVAAEQHLPDVDSLYASIGNGNVSAAHIVDLLAKHVQGEQAEPEPAPVIAQNKTGRSSGHHSSTEGVRVKGMDDILVKLARCCTPVPGDDVIGFVTRGSGVSVHRKDCKNMASLERQPERLVEVEWTGQSHGLYLVQIQVEALDRAGLLSDITKALSDYHVNILSASVATSRARVAQSRFVFEIGDSTHLGSVLSAVRQVDGVFDVYRITG
ncbi:bifunctional (p)ppGpp synthetase/guanosine-3',5'-bis(diphosphate) 3'-pyrophosphohydrolase [Brevibacterium sp. 91QC2O2]|uniref:RelA/SpoT family protein n=1 Tax=Brevibacterium TaxID=1696 RepID=UPI00211B915C|nr:MULTISPECIES: bifunctional (p)ppGpp synthetase/guanosine-3',5'-bis(diphosphate) 3'-pyrophosphohydrolase [unclassified Brevibacterium]MCQ9366908.1 bifunctional (p)ppGpp synthetase/guanosine-3',5'-bis(diphosphate) 3'-pyrophosphohydrolase [Brevibacterium sp. 91QC2O2]MCQ9384058.1 bifunctional (p)ppGpp synthetase/guanosine-3',5'-bis(diphosphate) 3'-pyrophosphohydrolase [Brevibacterium sp. 68QC2CO]